MSKQLGKKLPWCSLHNPLQTVWFVKDGLIWRDYFMYFMFTLFAHVFPVLLFFLCDKQHQDNHCAKKPVSTMLTYPWKCTVLHCNHLRNTWKPLVLMTRHFDYCPSASEGDNQSVRSSAPVVSRCFSGGYNVKLYISRGRLAWCLLAFLCC